MTPAELIAAARKDLELWDALGRPRALELIAALEAMQWRPIETAPPFQADGMKIIAGLCSKRTNPRNGGEV